MIGKVYKLKRKGMLKIQFIIAFLVLFVLILPAVGVKMYLDVIQLDEIGGFSQVYWTQFWVKTATFGISFLFLFLAFYLTNIFIKKNEDSFHVEPGIQKIRLPYISISLVFALIGAFLSKDIFVETVLNFLNSESFGSVDPIFNKDIGYYIFQRPFLMLVLDYLGIILLAVFAYTMVIYSIVLYLAYGTFTFNDLKRKGIVIHNIVNITLFFLIKAASYQFSMEGIMYNYIKNTRGAGYVDVVIWKNFYAVAPVIVLVSFILTIIFVLKGKLKAAVITTLTYAFAFILTSIIAAFVQAVFVNPSELYMEKPYLSYSIEKTREAYNIHNITEENFDLKQNLDAKILKNNADTVNNIRVVDYRATLRSNNQLQSIRTFFGFYNGDIINYNVNGKQMPVFIAARELDFNKIPNNTKYVNTMFKYTHGYGIVMNPFNSYSSSGQINFLLKDIEQNTVDETLKVEQPRIYYGEMTNHNVVVNANGINEIDKDINDETRYSGTGGIKLSILNRLMFALKDGDFNMLVSNYINDNSIYLLNRNVQKRVKMAAPFLDVDEDPYILVADNGHLVWVFDCYTKTDQFPYAQNYGDFNYIRNSVKALVDAYDGKVKFYVIDDSDPLIRTYKKIYTTVFTNSELPNYVKEHMRYPEKLYKIQTHMLRKYHFDPTKDQDSVDVFYNDQDIWEIAKYPDMQNNNQVTEMEPYYNMIKLPKGHSKEAELIVMTAFTPLGKDNMVSWLAAKNSYDEYGKFVLFTFPKQRQVYGPNQVESQINQEPDISSHMSLWGREGSRVFKGNLLAIPIEDSILFVEPLYTESTNDVSIPQVKEIVLGYQTGENMKIVYGATLNEALKKLFADEKITVGDTGKEALNTQEKKDNEIQQTKEQKSDDIQKVIDTFKEAKKSMSDGDFEKFGKNMKELEEAINKLTK